MVLIKYFVYFDRPVIMFSLSSKGLANLSWLEKDFSIIFTDKEYAISTTQAMFLSPAISKQQRIFKVLTTFKTEISDENGYFELVMQMLDGNEVKIPKEAFSFLSNLGKIFENKELESIGSTITEHEEINPSNAVSILKAKLENGENIEKEVEYIANHLFEMEESDIEELDAKTQKLILGNRKARVENESWRYSLIADQVKSKGDEYIELFETVDFVSLGANEINDFMTLVPANKLTQVTWENLRKRMILNTSSEKAIAKNEVVQKADKFVDSDEDNFPLKGKDGNTDGIISFLTEKFDGNVSEKGIVNIYGGTKRDEF